MLLASQNTSKSSSKKFQGKPGKFYKVRAGVSNFKFKVSFSISNFFIGISKLGGNILTVLIIQNDLAKTGCQTSTSKLNLTGC